MSILVEGVAWKIPSHIAMSIGWNIGIGRGCDEAFAVSIHVLEEKTAVFSSFWLTQVPKHVRSFGHTSGVWMVRGGQIVRRAVENHVSIADVIDTKPQRTACRTY